MKKLLLLSLVLISLAAFTQSPPAGNYIANKVDVVIYGGTPGGIAAALQAAGMGKTVTILEPSRHLGGHIVEGLGSADIDNHKEFRNSAALGGLALEFYRKLATYYNRTAAFENMLKNGEANTVLWKCESSVAEKIFSDWLKTQQVQVYTGLALAEGNGNVYKSGAELKSIRLSNGQLFEAAVFIDATYEGDLLHAAGVTTRVGRESNQTYGETLNGIRGETRHAQFAVKVDPYIEPGQRTSGLIPTILNESLGTPGGADTSLQAYCFRVCLTDSTANQLAFDKPEGYNRAEYEIYLRYIRAGGKLYTPRANLPNRKTDLGAWHDLSHNLYGMNRGYPTGDYAVRKNILDYHTRFTKGLFYFLTTDTAVGKLDPLLQQQWRKWGYAKDEFTDNGGFPRKFYVRDARRMVSDYVITEKTARKINGETVLNPVAVAYWPLDVHSVRRIVKNGYAYNEGFVFAGNTWKPFGISYGALVPKKMECTNLLTPTCVSSSHIAYGALRLEHNFMDLGQVCGIAAVMSINKRITVQQVAYPDLKAELLQAGLVIDPLGVTQANSLDSTRVFIQQNWQKVIHTQLKDSGSLIGLPKPYTVPGLGKNFQEMYYWDTYFTNVGLLLDGYREQARNNIENMLYLVNQYGFMPNGNRTFYLVRSQSPYLSMMIRDMYEATKDKKWLAAVLPALEKEYQFWMKERITATGLNHYDGNMADDTRKMSMFSSADRRLGISKRLPQLTNAEKITYGRHLIAECESGWDFTPRFQTKCADYLPVDLNSNLYMYECNFSFFYKELNKKSKEDWASLAEKRKVLMNKYLLNKQDGLFYDYDYVNQLHSTVLSAAVFNIIWSGLASQEQAKAMQQQLNRLEAAHGIASCEPGQRTASYQWDSPNGWANLQYVAVKGLDRYGYAKDAKRIAGKYANMVAANFSATHNLWEKYNVQDGSLNATNEYGLPTMMGWTAGVFSYCYQYIQ